MKHMARRILDVTWLNMVVVVGIALAVFGAAFAGADDDRSAELHQPPAGRAWGDEAAGFRLVSHADRIDVQLDGSPIASYVFRHDSVRRPFLAHVKTPGGRQVTRNFPPIAGQDRVDHADMHPGVWLAFGKLSGVDFWRNQGRVVHEGFVGDLDAGTNDAGFTTRNAYRSPDGALICRQRSRYRFARDPDGYRIDIEATFSSDEPFAFGVQEEMGLGLRVATPLAVINGSGMILNSEGGRDEKETWGQVAQWWDYSGVLDGMTAGVMIMSGQGNPDVWSHSRDYGFLAANPFPVDRPENRSRETVVSPGMIFSLRFGVLVHEHEPASDFDRAAAYRRYLAAGQARSLGAEPQP